MPRYKFVGDEPRSLPALGIEVVYPGQVVDVPEEIVSGDFQLVTEAKKAAKADKEEG